MAIQPVQLSSVWLGKGREGRGGEHCNNNIINYESEYMKIHIFELRKKE